ncbi:putative holin-like toxin [Enterococcus hirae]|nr:putative holin-like toxin [Enterococcus hirae]
MGISTKSMKGVCFLSTYEIVQTMLGFGTFTIALVSLIVTMLKNDKKK